MLCEHNSYQYNMMQLLVLLVCSLTTSGLLVGSEYLSQARIGSDSYRLYLSTNLARFIAYTTHQVMCPDDPGLLHGEHLEICLDTEINPAELEKLSNKSQQNYIEAAESYSDWIDEIETDSDSVCEGEQNTETIADRLGKIPLADFWPFNLDVIKLNQILGILGISEDLVKRDDSLKQEYFEAMAMLQNTTLLPLKPDGIVLSFDDGRFVKTLVDKNYAKNSIRFMFSGGHLYEESERKQLHDLAERGLKLIKGVNEELHKCIVQSIAAIGFYKGEDQTEYSAGTTVALLGAVWMNPPLSWSAIQVADGIVHEFVHTALNEAELVHGMVVDDAMRKKVKTTSAIRREHRPYDKSFHAAYVSTGLALFHSHALLKLSPDDKESREAHLKILSGLLETVGSSISELLDQERKHHLLNASGKAMLRQMATVAERSCIIPDIPLPTQTSNTD